MTDFPSLIVAHDGTLHASPGAWWCRACGRFGILGFAGRCDVCADDAPHSAAGRHQLRSKRGVATTVVPR